MYVAGCHIRRGGGGGIAISQGGSHGLAESTDIVGPLLLALEGGQTKKSRSGGSSCG